jgi:soluble lytic murein transglycosylase-like protein
MGRVGKKLSLGVIACLWLAGSEAQATIYIYQVPGGGRVITDHVMHNKYYKLVRTSTNIKGMGALLASKNTDAILADPSAYDEIIKKVAMAHRVDVALIKAVVHAESGFNPRALSKKGASGLMQLMPETARRYGVLDPFDPAQNLSGGVLYLKDLLRIFNDNHRLAIAAYNAGENAVKRYKGVPPYEETRAYVRKVLRFRSRYAVLVGA